MSGNRGVHLKSETEIFNVEGLVAKRIWAAWFGQSHLSPLTRLAHVWMMCISCSLGLIERGSGFGYQRPQHSTPSRKT